MRRRVTAGLASAAAALLAAGVVTAPASAAPAAEPAPGVEKAKHKDSLPDAKADQNREVRKQAVANLLKGKAKLQTRNGSKVIEVKDDLFVEYEQAPKVRSSRCWSTLATRSIRAPVAAPARWSTRSPSRTATGTAAPPTTTAPCSAPTSTASTT